MSIVSFSFSKRSILIVLALFLNLTLLGNNDGGKYQDLPWEISNSQGESYLPDIFYAESVQNDQIMPTGVRVPYSNYTYAIDHVIYPTIGNPNLYVKQAAGSKYKDSLDVVLRLEKKIADQLLTPSNYKSSDGVSASGDNNGSTQGGVNIGIRFFLIPRSLRQANERSSTVARLEGVIEIKPTSIGRHDVGKYIAPFNERYTIQVNFDNQQMDSIADGLYDLRAEFAATSESKAFYEFHYNAVSIHPVGSDQGKYNVINVTDSQVSISTIIADLTHLDFVDKKAFKKISHDRLDEFVEFINQSDNTDIRSAHFITFNGDLHNGGAPMVLRPEDVAHNYNSEAEAILAILKKLNKPIFLTAGNHDGYVSTGHVPKPYQPGPLQKVRGVKTLKEVISEVKGQSAVSRWEEYVKQTEDLPGGRHVDVYSGKYIRRGHARTMKGNGRRDMGWQKVDPKEENVILYDGFYQWKKVYGPLYFSWTFGRNHYLNINSYDLRQHRRTGWGMYTVNYGGDVSASQMDWIIKDLKRNHDKDVIVLAHHDPRGGHKGQDYPYYFKQVDYEGMDQSAKNYVRDEVISPVKCKSIPDWAKQKKTYKNCLHDGLQEWMRADPEFDCQNQHLLANGKCDPGVFKVKNVDIAVLRRAVDEARTIAQEASAAGNGNAELWAAVTQSQRALEEGLKKVKKHPVYSGYRLIHHLASQRNVRTVLLGHTHFNSVQMMQSGDEIVPTTLELDHETDERLAAQLGKKESRLAHLEAVNPFRARGRAKQQGVTLENLSEVGITQDNRGFSLNLRDAGHSFQNKVKGKKRELAVLRMTSIANMSVQKTSGDEELMFGFTVFKVRKVLDERNFGIPQINSVLYFQNMKREDGQPVTFRKKMEFKLPRTLRFDTNHDVDARNPLFGEYKEGTSN